jgi:hypothetical protein
MNCLSWSWIVPRRQNWFQKCLLLRSGKQFDENGIINILIIGRGITQSHFFIFRLSNH